EIVKTLRDKKIPADVIYLDIDYQQGYAPFTINREYFPTFEKMISDLRAQGFHTILITDLHIKKDPNHGYAPYDSGIKSDAFVKNPDGSIYVGKVWPGDSVFPDFTLTRAADTGAPRYAATWTGDNSSTWNHLKMSTPMLMSMGISGMPLVGDDIGGFAGSPTPDLLTRWFEVGALNPIYRDHTAKGTADQEPWIHGPEHEAIRKKYIELRYRLMLYLYTAIEETTRTGIPLMRPLFLEYPQAAGFYGDDRDFLFGRDLFVAPVTTEMVDPE